MRRGKESRAQQITPGRKRQTFTNLTILQALLLDPCDDDDTAASMACICNVRDVSLHVDLFPPPHCQSPATEALPPMTI